MCIRVDPLYRQLGARDRRKKIRLPLLAHDPQSHMQMLQTICWAGSGTALHKSQGEGYTMGYLVMILSRNKEKPPNK